MNPEEGLDAMVGDGSENLVRLRLWLGSTSYGASGPGLSEPSWRASATFTGPRE